MSHNFIYTTICVIDNKSKKHKNNIISDFFCAENFQYSN